VSNAYFLCKCWGSSGSGPFESRRPALTETCESSSLPQKFMRFLDQIFLTTHISKLKWNYAKTNEQEKPRIYRDTKRVRFFEIYRSHSSIWTWTQLQEMTVSTSFSVNCLDQSCFLFPKMPHGMRGLKAKTPLTNQLRRSQRWWKSPLFSAIKHGNEKTPIYGCFSHYITPPFIRELPLPCLTTKECMGS
jgi:hypothetical protein